MGHDEGTELEHTMANDNETFRRSTRRDEPTEALKVISDDDSRPLRFGGDSGTKLPHWSNPPTGEVPRTLRRESRIDDTNDWSSLSNPPAWRDSQREADLVDLTDDSMRLGALAKRADDPANPFPELDGGADPRRPTRSVFDEPDPDGTRDESWGGFDDPEMTGAAAAVSGPLRTKQVKVGGDRASSRRPAAAGKAGRDMPMAILVGAGLLALGVVCFFAGLIPTLALVTLILGAAGFEYCSGLTRAGHAPATPVVVAGCAAMPLGAYAQGGTGMVVVGVLATVGCLLWYLFADAEAPAVTNASMSMLGVAWIGLLGGTAGLMLQMYSFLPGEDSKYGIQLILVTVLATVAHDVFALLVGSSAGTTKLAPSISPNKTREGLIGGIVAVIATCMVMTMVATLIEDWKHGLALAIAIAIAAPLGDLVESRMKRDLGIKDFGTILPGHGGILDRFDGFLFTLPAAFMTAMAFDLFLL
jgi:phosphatidate cytidylyltransferase